MPKGKRPVITPAEIEALNRKGWTQTAIAKQFGVTRSYISWIVRKYGGTLTPRQLVLEQHFPWRVPASMQSCSAYRNLRNHGEQFMTDGVGMNQLDLDRLPGFYRQFRDHVLEYDPTFPPKQDFAADGGFTRRERTAEDGKLLIRINEQTTMTDAGWHLWTLPSSEL